MRARVHAWAGAARTGIRGARRGVLVTGQPRRPRIVVLCPPDGSRRRELTLRLALLFVSGSGARRVCTGHGPRRGSGARRTTALFLSSPLPAAPWPAEELGLSSVRLSLGFSYCRARVLFEKKTLVPSPFKESVIYLVGSNVSHPKKIDKKILSN